MNIDTIINAMTNIDTIDTPGLIMIGLGIVLLGRALVIDEI